MPDWLTLFSLLGGGATASADLWRHLRDICYSRWQRHTCFSTPGTSFGLIAVSLLTVTLPRSTGSISSATSTIFSGSHLARVFFAGAFPSTCFAFAFPFACWTGVPSPIPLSDSPTQSEIFIHFVEVFAGVRDSWSTRFALDPTFWHGGISTTTCFFVFIFSFCCGVIARVSESSTSSISMESPSPLALASSGYLHACTEATSFVVFDSNASGKYAHQ